MPGPNEDALRQRINRSKGELVAEALESFTIATVAAMQARGPMAMASADYLARLDREKSEARRDLVQALSGLVSRPTLRLV